MIIAAIGDVHGCLDQLKQLVSVVSAKHKPDKLVLLGDYVDRGPDSRGVIKYVRELVADGVVALKGNHEDLMVNCMRGMSNHRIWLVNGGDKTLAQYDDDPDGIALDRDREFLSGLPTHYVTDRFVFVHAGIPPGAELPGHSSHDLMWFRGEQARWHGKRVVHGHTPVKAPIVNDNHINIDTGCVFGGPLTAAILNDETGFIKALEYVDGYNHSLDVFDCDSRLPTPSNRGE